jgi:hypothetical protein
MPPSDTISVFQTTATMVASVNSRCCVSRNTTPSDETIAAADELDRGAFQHRHAATETAEIQSAGDEPGHTDECEDQALQPRRTFQRRFTNHEADAQQAQHQTEPLRSAQPLAEQQHAECGGQQRRQRLHQRNLRGRRFDQCDVRRHQADAIEQRAGHSAMKPAPISKHRHDRRNASIAIVSTTAQPTSRIATNNSGDRCRKPTLAVMKEELHSRTNRNGTIRIIPPVEDSGRGRAVSSASCAMLGSCLAQDPQPRVVLSRAFLPGSHAGSDVE